MERAIVAHPPQAQLTIAACLSIFGALTIVRVAPASSSRSQGATNTPSAGDITGAMRALRMAGDGCDYEDIVRRARDLRGRAQHASDAWIEACAHEVIALHELWAPDELGNLALELERAIAVRRRAEPGVVRSAAGPLLPPIAPYVVQAQISAAHLFQARGDHMSALGRLRFVLDDLPRGPCAGFELFQQRALIAAARSLELSGRLLESRAALESLRDQVGSGGKVSKESQLATVLLENGAQGHAAYRGKYGDDPLHRSRMEELRGRLPAARARLARMAAIPESDVPEVILGVADAGVDESGMAAATVYDPRTPCFAPIIVFHSETLALGLLDLEQVLVHELSHAWLLVRAGQSYENLPPWLVESVAEGLAEQTDLNFDNYFTSVMLPRPEAALSGHFSKLHAIEFETKPCVWSPVAAAGLAISHLLDHGGIQALRTLVHALRAGRSADSALELATGFRTGAYLDAAREHVLFTIEERRLRSLTAVHGLVRAESNSPRELLREANSVIEANPARPARGLALWKRARALESLKSYDEARRAYDVLIDERLEQPGYVELARMGRARCLIAEGKRVEARSELAALRRDALTPEAAVWCSEQLRELASQDAKLGAPPIPPR